MKGILLVDKPAGMTSHDVVNRVRRAAGMRRVGHTGTLDPLATGLLVLCLGEATRLAEFVVGMEKVYKGRMRFGVVTDSYDMDGDVVEEHPVPDLSLDDVQEACSRFVGAIEQTPPMVSAVKVGGERLYKKARKGEVVERAPRKVRVHDFRVLEVFDGEAAFVLRCSRGVYARSLCHDAGQELGCGAALAQLRRTAVGKHLVENAAPLDSLQTAEDVLDALTPIEHALDLPVVRVIEQAKDAVAHGNAVERNMLLNGTEAEGWVQLISERGEFLALAEAVPGNRFQPRRVLCERP
jgi:tRNA pseudouridine55 synthase